MLMKSQVNGTVLTLHIKSGHCHQYAKNLFIAWWPFCYLSHERLYILSWICQI